jgi:hypothetical protein
MSVIDGMGADLYEFLKANINKGYTFGDLIRELGWRPNAKARTAIERARDLAIADGKFFPDAVPATGRIYAVVDEPSLVYDAALHLYRHAAGVKARQHRHDDFIDAHERQLPRADRRIIQVVRKVEAQRREQDQAINELIGIVVSQRNQVR